MLRVPILQNTCGRLLLYWKLIILQQADFFLQLRESLSSTKSFMFQISSKNKEFYYLLFHIFESEKKLFQPFLFPVIQCLPLCPKIKSSNQTKLVHCRSISNDQQLFQGLMLASRVEPHCKEGLQFFSVRVFFQEYWQFSGKGRPSL